MVLCFSAGKRGTRKKVIPRGSQEIAEADSRQETRLWQPDARDDLDDGLFDDKLELERAKVGAQRRREGHRIMRRGVFGSLSL